MKRIGLFCALAGITLLLPLAAARAEQEFARNLHFGLRQDPEVVRMQEFLRLLGYFTYPESTGNYFTATLEAVARFQADQGIAPLGGYFGPRSRVAANRILAERGAGSGAGVGVGQGAPAPSGAGVGGAGSAPAASATSSPYRGKIAISYVFGSSAAPSGESLTLQNKTEKEQISVTGFRVENSRGESFAIPQGESLPGFSLRQNGDVIVLNPGDRVVISMGKQERRINFRENLCTGYFDETSEFSPALGHDCPRPDVRRNLSFSDRCIRAIESTSLCRVGRADASLEQSCAAFIESRLNYAGCVRESRARPDFYSRRWLVWMQRDREFFRDLAERITLRDPQGKVVAEYGY